MRDFFPFLKIMYFNSNFGENFLRKFDIKNKKKEKFRMKKMYISGKFWKMTNFLEKLEKQPCIRMEKAI